MVGSSLMEEKIVLATFMEETLWLEEVNKNCSPHKPLYYHKCWNTLMPVVEKIRSLGIYVSINKWSSVYNNHRQNGAIVKVFTSEGADTLINTYNVCLKFIKDLNK